MKTVLAVRYIRSMPMSEDLVDHVVSTAERLEELESPHALDPLDIQYTVDARGTVREVTVILGTGGPHIEAKCYEQTVTGYWASDRHSTHTDSKELSQYGEIVADRFEERIQ
jgi:hypothetical protein